MSPAGPQNADRTHWFLMPVLGLILGWFVLITQTRYHWGGESYYNFGWFVPIMAGWLLLGNLSSLTPANRKTLLPHLLLSGICILPIIPFHALSEVNPFWRLPLWIQASGLFVYSLVQLHSLYGWKGVWRSIFPLFFLTTMIPWPYRLEVLIVQMLTEVVVVLSMDGLHFLGYPVELAGNSFHLGEMDIGVNEACSGIRSLQALFMVTLFLGSLFGQGWMRRLAAVLILPLVVVLVNAARAIFLAMQVIENGEAAYDEWHDPAGYIAFGVSMVLIYACIELFNIGAQGEGVSRTFSVRELAATLTRIRLPRSAALFPVFPLLLYGVVEGWFRYHEARSDLGRSWELVLPANPDPSMEMIRIHPQVEETLGYDYSTSFLKTISRRVWCQVYYYGYTPENKLSSVSSYGHAPTICMRATGAVIEKQFEDLMIPVRGGPTLQLKHYLFRLGDTGSTLHIFWTVWERRNMDIEPEDLQTLDYRTQWIQLLKGRRDFSRKVLLVSMAGIEGSEEAGRELRGLLSDWLVGKPD
ncbi:MAG: exosortase/archaeosortase family protein [Oceanipulchritudo sp.]